MRLRMLVVLLCAVALASGCVPAFAYQIEAENILNSPDWKLCVPTTAIPASVVAEAGYASGGSALRIVDNVASQKKDIHAVGNIEDVAYSTAAAGELGDSATVVFRMRTTGDYPFTPTAGTTDGAGWERNIVLGFSDGTWRKSVGFAVRPDAATITNTTSTTQYPTRGWIPVDNTVWHTWTIVATNFASGGGNASVYLDGVLKIDNLTVNLTTDTAIVNTIGYVDGLTVMAGIGGTSRDGTGSWLFDRIAYKAGADPTWKPWGEPTGSISGVVSKAGSPATKIENAVVTLNSGQRTTTGPGGTYSFVGIEPNPCKVTASAYGLTTADDIIVGADGYFSTTSAVAPITFAATAATKNVEVTAVPALGAPVSDTFRHAGDDGALIQTEDARHLPWNVGGELPDGGFGTGYYADKWTPVLHLNTQDTHGVSIDNFLPANVDFSVDLSSVSGSNWAGISYRQNLPCTFDIYNGQAGEDAGYVVLCYYHGKSIDLWRNGAIASARVSIDWTIPHKFRVIAFGNHHEVLIDGVRVLSAVDSGKLSGGYVGLLRDKSSVLCANVAVSELASGSSLGTISGSVYSAASPATKLAGALVLLSDGRSTFADANGSYSFGMTSLDSVTVTAKAAGYLDKSANVDPILGANTANFGLSADTAFKASINAAKAAPVNSPVAIASKVITATWSGTTMYIEEPGRFSGIKVTLPASDPSLGAKAGKPVDVRGTLRSDAQTGELYIEAGSVYEPPVAQNILLPLFMNGRAVLSGANVTGLDVKVAGKVKAVNSPNDYTIDDGYGDLKIIVGPTFTLATWPAVDDYVDVEGIVSLDGATPGSAVRCVRRWK